MAANRPTSFIQIFDIPAADTEPNIFVQIPEARITEASFVQFSLNREAVTVLITVKVGSDEVLPSSPVTLEATVGVLPSIRDDTIIETFAQAGDIISIAASNSDGAAAREIRAIVRVTAINDMDLVQVMKARQVA